MSVTRDRINTFFRYKDLLRELVVRDVKLKYRRSFLGYVWSILNPLLIMLVMTLVFFPNVPARNRKLSGLPADRSGII